MSGASGEKTELPTPKKLRDARAKGQVARSQDVVTAVSLIAVTVTVMVSFPAMITRLIDLITRAGNRAGAAGSRDFSAVLLAMLQDAGMEVISILGPVLLVCVVSAIAANFAQVGALFTFEGIKPSLSKISPASGFKKIFSLKQLVETLKSILKIVFLTVLFWSAIRGSIQALMLSLSCGLTCMFSVSTAVLQSILAYTALGFIVVAVADFAYQKHSHTKSLMMSHDEIKREYKESEGDPHVKGHRKQVAHELIMSDAGAATRKSSALVVNPTHFAVAIRYDAATMPLPMVVAKGRNHMAHFLRAEAEQAGVPVFRNVPLARSLFAETNPGDFIPEEAFAVIAEVLVWIENNRDALYQGRLHHGDIDMDEGHWPGRASANPGY